MVPTGKFPSSTCAASLVYHHKIVSLPLTLSPHWTSPTSFIISRFLGLVQGSTFWTSFDSQLASTTAPLTTSQIHFGLDLHRPPLSLTHPVLQDKSLYPYPYNAMSDIHNLTRGQGGQGQILTAAQAMIDTGSKMYLGGVPGKLLLIIIIIFTDSSEQDNKIPICLGFLFHSLLHSMYPRVHCIHTDSFCFPYPFNSLQTHPRHHTQLNMLLHWLSLVTGLL